MSQVWFRLQTLFDDEARPCLGLGVNLGEILPDNSQTKQLDSPQHIEGNNDGSPAWYGGRVEESGNQRPGRQTEAEKRDKHSKQSNNCLLYTSTFMPNASGNFPGMLSGSSSGLLMEPYLESHYKLVEDDHGVRIMERKDDNLAK